jgi:hypothetical protein
VLDKKLGEQVIVRVQVMTVVQVNMRMLVISGCTVGCRGQVIFGGAGNLKL